MPKFDISGHRMWWFLLSAVVIAAGIVCMVVRGFNFGIDFTGGTIIDLKFSQPVTIQEVRTSLAQYDLDGSTIQLSGAASDVTASEDVMIRTVDLEEEQRKAVMASLKTDVGDYTVLREEKVGATIGGELIENAVLALVISWALIILYVAYRFEWKFGVAAVLALVHDILVVLGVFALTQRQIDSSFIAALLTIVGYSINDTIVIFDRIREELRNPKSKNLPLKELCNKCLNGMLSRTLLTSLTTAITVVALLVFSKGDIRDFAVVMLFGVVIGTFSSIFVATPVMIAWHKGKRPDLAVKK